MLVAVLPLEEAQRASKVKQAPQQGSPQGAAHAAGAAAATRASGSQPAAASLSKEMLRLGEWLAWYTVRVVLNDHQAPLNTSWQSCCAHKRQTCVQNLLHVCRWWRQSLYHECMPNLSRPVH